MGLLEADKGGGGEGLRVVENDPSPCAVLFRTNSDPFILRPGQATAAEVSNVTDPKTSMSNSTGNLSIVRINSLLS